MIHSVGGVGLKVRSFDDLAQEEVEKENYLLESEEDESSESSMSELAGYITSEFEKNRQDKIESGIEEEILNSLRQFNGEYSPAEQELIANEGGSKIFMNITAVKSRAAKSWSADIYQSSKDKIWELDSTTLPDLPDEIEQMIEQAIQKEFQEMASSAGQGGVSVEKAQETIRNINQMKRDVREAISNEISKEASFQMKQMEKKVRDQLEEGKWSKALLDFLDDFYIYPTAFMKGPVISKRKVPTWENGQVVQKETYIFGNERIDPLDIYPSKGATTIDEGNLCEHLRFTDPSELINLKGIEGYRDEAIDRILEEGQTGSMWYDLNIEQEKADQERRGSIIGESDIIHGIHFHGKVSTNKLLEFDDEFSDLPENEYREVEAILVGNEVIKVMIKEDTVLGRPYHKASFINRPGSFWGRSLPMLMQDIQRMCNAAARALANNMAVASGPSVEVYIDRLADDKDIEGIRPFQVWQLKSDPTGSGGRAIQWNQPTSNAAELLKVYQEFEARADDVTGIPRYAYGNENLAGAGTTASGLAMLLESASKIIKDAIRNIDEGLIKPRVEYQFYYNLLQGNTNFTGDIKVVPRGSTVLTIRAFEALRRNEFLSLTANETDQKTMGSGRAELLRVIAEDLGLPYNVIPTSYELKKMNEREVEAQRAEQENQMKMEEMRQQNSLQATQIQIEGQKEMAKAAQEVEMLKAQLKDQIENNKLQLEQWKTQVEAMLGQQKLETESKVKTDLQNREIALKLKGGEGI